MPLKRSGIDLSSAASPGKNDGNLMVMEENSLNFRAFVADPESRSMIESVVDAMLIPHAKVERGTAREATEAVRKAENSPHTLLVDVDDSEMPLSEIEALADVCEPSVQVIVIGQSTSLGLFRELIQRGVVDYITKPVTRDLLERAIRLAQTGQDPWQSRRRTGKLVATTGARGGAGASTLALNVAWLLAHKQSRRVALVDMDLHTGSLGMMVNVETGHGLRNALEAPNQISRTSLERALIKIDERLYLLNSEEPLGEPVAYDEQGVDTLLEELTQLFHFVIVDVPRSPDPVHQHILHSAQIRLLVTDATVVAARDVIREVSAITRDEVGYRTYLVLNRRWPAGRGDVSVKAFANTVGRAIDFEIPYGRGTVAATVNAGEILARQNGGVTDAISNIAAEVGGQGTRSAGGWRARLRRIFNGG